MAVIAVMILAVKVGVLCPVQQPGLYCEVSQLFSIVGVEPTQK